MIGGTRYVRKIAIPVFSAPGSFRRASAYPAGTAVNSVITATHAEIMNVFQSHAP